MRSRSIRHIIFWCSFVLIYVISDMFFSSSSELKYSFGLRLLRSFLNELAFLPWKIIPFYFLFYFLLPKYLKDQAYFKIGGYLFLVILICLFGYRSMIAPVSSIMYGETPDFNVFSFRRLFYTLTEILPALGLASATKLLLGRIGYEQRQTELRKEKNIAELKFLKAQTNPHFLFNTLNNLYGLARRKDDNTASSILKLSSLMRYILQEGTKDTILLSHEINIIENYIALEKLRYDHRLEVTFSKSIDDPQIEIAPLILLPFVENAFKHGTSESRFDASINIQIQANHQHLFFSISNTRNDHEIEISEGVGLKNIKRQLELIYGNSHELIVENEPESFTVKLNINLNHKES